MDEGPTPPSMDGRQCISFSVSGPWGHFRRVEGNIVKQTYRLIPRTTVAGLTAAIVGAPRDSYYESFHPERSAIAVTPTRRLRTMNMPMNVLSTAGEHLTTISKKLGLKMVDPAHPRQQHNYEVLVDPAYRIDLWLEDEEYGDRLRSMLEEGRSHYVPSLGLSEHLANIEFLGEHEVLSGPSEGTVEVDSAIPHHVDSVVPDEDHRHMMERSPAYMEAAEADDDWQGRRTLGYFSYAYSPDGGPLPARDVRTHTVDGRTVVFA